MRTKRLLGVVVPPALTLGGVLVIGELSCLEAWTTNFETLLRATTVVAGLWLATATGMAVLRTRRDTHSHRRLQKLRELAAEPNRALVHVQTTVWSSAAGQHAGVVNVATGILHRVWIPEVTVPIGAFVVLQPTRSGVSIVDWMSPRRVDEAHRFERRHPTTSDPRDLDVELALNDDVRRLIEETEHYLRQR